MKLFSNIDVTIAITYFVIVMMISLLIVFIRQGSGDEYFYGSRNMGWIGIGFSLFISHISAVHLLGIIENMWSPLFLEWLTIPLILTLGWFVIPLYRKLNLKTIPQLFGQLYNRSIQNYISGVSIIFYIFIRMLIPLIAGSILLTKFFNWNTSSSIYLILILTGLYVVVSGFRAVIYTQVLQAFIVMSGILVIIITGINRIPETTLAKTNILNELYILLNPWTLDNVPLTGVLIIAPIFLIWYWCVDQYMVQRLLSARSTEEARTASILTSFLIFFSIIFLLIFGIVLRTQFHNMSSIPGFQGLLLIILLSLIMSSLSNTIISASTLFVVDFYKPKNPNASERKIVLIGRLFSIGIVVISIFTFTLLNRIDIFNYQKILIIPIYIAAPIIAVFVLGIFHRKGSVTAAKWTLNIGFILIFIKILMDFGLLDFVKLSIINNLHYLYFIAILFGISVFAFYGISIVTSTTNGNIINTGFNDVFKNLYLINVGDNQQKMTIGLSTLLILMTVSLWIFFS